MPFDFSWSEIFVVVIVAVVVIGPKELPKALRALGRIIGKLRRTADEFRRHFDETMREAGAEDLQREIHELRYNNPISEIRNTVENAARDMTNSTSLRIDEPATAGQSQAGETAAGDAKASPTSAPAPTSSPAPENASDAAPSGQTKAVECEVAAKDAAQNVSAPTDNSDPANSDKPPLK
jgi:sec-independent protein translocase protein TatB